MLESIGLDEPAEEAYRLLLRQESLTADEVARETALPRPRAARALQALAAAGLAARRPGRPARYEPVDPRSGLAALVRSRQAELEQAVASVAVYAAEYQERRLRADPRLMVEVIEGPAEINRRLQELTLGAEHEIMAFDAPPYVTPYDSASELERGLAVRGIYASEVLEVPRLNQQLRRMVELGEQARVLPRVPMKLLLVDRREAILPLTASGEGVRTTAAVVRRSSLCDALVELFEANWARATPVFAPPSAMPAAPDHPELSDADRALLHLLNAGLKDEAIARQLGLSQRTFRRRIADLTVRLGATSRFQAGAQALRRGWL